MDSAPIPEQKVFNIPSSGGRAKAAEGLKAMKANNYLLFPDKPDGIRDHSKFHKCKECEEYYGDD